MDKKETSNSKIISNSIIYSASGLLIKCFGFFLLPLYTQYLTKSDYGVTSIATSFISTMSFIAAFSLYSAVMRFYVDLKDDPQKLSRFYGTISLFVLISASAFGVVLTFFKGFLEKKIFSGTSFFPIIFVCLISLVFECQHTIYQNVLRSQQKAVKCSVLSLGYFFVTLGLNITFVVFLKKGALGVVLATMTANVLYTVYYWADMLLHGYMKICIDLPVLKEALKYSVPIMPHNLSTNIATLVSKALIGGKVTLGALGVYSVATQFGNVTDTIQTYINNAYSPWLFEKLKDGDEGYKKSIRSVVRMLCSVIGVFFIGISLFAQDYIVLFVQKSYVKAWTYIPLIILVYAIKTIYYFYVSILLYYKKASKILFTATLTSSILNILLSYVFIPLWGVYGSLLADALSMLVRVGIVVVISLRFENIGLKISDFLLNFAIIATFIFGGLAFSCFKYKTTFSLLNFGYKILVMAAYCGLVFVMHRTEITRYIKSFKNKKIKKGEQKQ